MGFFGYLVILALCFLFVTLFAEAEEAHVPLLYAIVFAILACAVK